MDAIIGALNIAGGRCTRQVREANRYSARPPLASPPVLRSWFSVGIFPHFSNAAAEEDPRGEKEARHWPLRQTPPPHLRKREKKAV